MSNRLRDIGSNPTIRNFAKDSSQAAIRKVASFLAPTVEVPTLTGQYKVYDAKNRYKRPKTIRGIDGKATRIGFTADDQTYNLVPRALDFPIPNAEALNADELQNMAQYGTSLLADSAGLDDEAETIELALATVGAGTDVNFVANGFDPIARIDTEIKNVMKLAKNGAAVRVLFGVTALERTKNNPQVLSRFNGTPAAKALKVPDMLDVSKMLLGQPECDVAFMVQDTAAEGLAEAIEFLLDEAIIIFACNGNPNTMDPSFMKTFRLMGKWMTPGSYLSQDERDEVLKMDWYGKKVVTNATAAVRLNAKNA